MPAATGRSSEVWESCTRLAAAGWTGFHRSARWKRVDSGTSIRWTQVALR